MTKCARKGFALTIALWAVVGGAALLLVLFGAARDGIGAARNRGHAERAYWHTFGCEQRLRAAMQEVLWPDQFTSATTRAAWMVLDSIVIPGGDSLRWGCRFALEPSGMRVNVNTATPDELRKLVGSMTRHSARTDSIVDGILDWRDLDDAREPFGAERDWYVANHRVPPRNGPLMAVEELGQVRGVAEVQGLVDMFGVDSVRVLWPRAPRAVVASLPGMTEEALDVFGLGRQELTDLALLASMPELSVSARHAMETSSHLLIPAVASTPDYWTVRTTASDGSPATPVSLETRVVLSDRRLLVTRHVERP